ncbi:hypothetical protein HDU98_011752 [Podochytrium sp. JEL0797]|nr:hypothetical protein HDU98_011752 [Podochytrium sp. JEL0797]
MESQELLQLRQYARTLEDINERNVARIALLEGDNATLAARVRALEFAPPSPAFASPTASLHPAWSQPESPRQDALDAALLQRRIAALEAELKAQTRSAPISQPPPAAAAIASNLWSKVLQAKYPHFVSTSSNRKERIQAANFAQSHGISEVLKPSGMRYLYIPKNLHVAYWRHMKQVMGPDESDRHSDSDSDHPIPPIKKRKHAEDENDTKRVAEEVEEEDEVLEEGGVATSFPTKCVFPGCTSSEVFRASAPLKKHEEYYHSATAMIKFNGDEDAKAIERRPDGKVQCLCGMSYTSSKSLQSHANSCYLDPRLPKAKPTDLPWVDLIRTHLIPNFSSSSGNKVVTKSAFVFRNAHFLKNKSGSGAFLVPLELQAAFLDRMREVVDGLGAQDGSVGVGNEGDAGGSGSGAVTAQESTTKFVEAKSVICHVMPDFPSLDQDDQSTIESAVQSLLEEQLGEKLAECRLPNGGLGVPVDLLAAFQEWLFEQLQSSFGEMELRNDAYAF